MQVITYSVLVRRVLMGFHFELFLHVPSRGSLDLSGHLLLHHRISRLLFLIFSVVSVRDMLEEFMYGLIGTITGVLILSSFIPQLQKAYKTKKMSGELDALRIGVYPCHLSFVTKSPLMSGRGSIRSFIECKHIYVHPWIVLKLSYV
jgi:hypothetical protein